MEKSSTQKIVLTGVIAALYAVLTIIIAPIAYGPIQFRLSEVLVLLAFLNPIYIVGLTLGCLLANLFSGYGMMDVIFGTLATFISCIAIYFTKYTLKNNKKSLFVASIWPTIFNGLIIGWMLYYVANYPMLLTMAQVAIGEFVVVTVIGVPLMWYFSEKYGKYL